MRNIKIFLQQRKTPFFPESKRECTVKIFLELCVYCVPFNVAMK